MSERIPQGVAIRVPLQAFLASDHFSPATGLTTTIVITISKNGAAYAATNAAETSHEIASGSYYADLNATDTGTVGPLFVRGAVATMDPITVIYNVVVDVAQTGDSYARLGAPAGASVSADVAAVKVDTAAVKVKTDFLPSVTAGGAGGVFIAGTNAATAITTGLTAHIIGTVDTLTTYTGNTPQSGDSFARIGALGAGLTGITGATLAAAYDAAKTASQAGNAMALTAGERQAIADAWTARNVAGGSSAGRTNGQAMAAIRNKVEIVAGVLTVYDVDDVTPLFTAAVATAAGNPISSIDPA